MDKLLFLNLGSLEWLIIAVVLLAYPALVVYCLTSITRSVNMTSVNKILWVVVIVFAPFIGSILYLLVGRERDVPPKI